MSIALPQEQRVSWVYETIAEDYRKSRRLPFRQHIEEYTLLTLTGSFAGKSVLDLACGEGTYSRIAKRAGATRVVGVDLSETMIGFARQEEARAPLGIEYLVRDVCELGRVGEFDLVLASYLLNYARTEEHLRQMCTVIAANLRPGGRFIAMNNNPEQTAETFEQVRRYGFTKRVQQPSLQEGSPITIIIVVEGREIQFENYYLSFSAHERALRSVGFKEVRWQPLLLSPEGAKANGAAFWRDFLDCQPIIALEATG